MSPATANVAELLNVIAESSLSRTGALRARPAAATQVPNVSQAGSVTE
jgi:hypothetical protein